MEMSRIMYERVEDRYAGADARPLCRRCYGRMWPGGKVPAARSRRLLGWDKVRAWKTPCATCGC